MTISDLEILEVVREDEDVLGGSANANAYSDASARGRRYASTYTDTYTSANSNRWSKSAYSGSRASSYAD